jgi:hypothetical protein
MQNPPLNGEVRRLNVPSFNEKEYAKQEKGQSIKFINSGDTPRKCRGNLAGILLPPTLALDPVFGETRDGSMVFPERK